MDGPRGIVTNFRYATWTCFFEILDGEGSMFIIFLQNLQAQVNFLPYFLDCFNNNKNILKKFKIIYTIFFNTFSI